MFRLWWDFRQRQVSRAELQTGLEPVIQELQEALEQGRTCADPKVATFCTNVLALYPALWLFARVSSRRTTTSSGFCVLVCCGGRTPLAITVRRVAALRSGY